MKTISMIIMVAIVLEALVEYGKTIMYMVEDEDYKTAVTQGITIVLGVLLAFAFRLQLFNGALSEFYEGLTVNSTVDIILTGILFSRGSNYVSDLVGKLTASSAQIIDDAEGLIYEENEEDESADEEEDEEDVADEEEEA